MPAEPISGKRRGDVLADAIPLLDVGATYLLAHFNRGGWFLAVAHRSGWVLGGDSHGC